MDSLNVTVALKFEVVERVVGRVSVEVRDQDLSVEGGGVGNHLVEIVVEELVALLLEPGLGVADGEGAYDHLGNSNQLNSFDEPRDAFGLALAHSEAGSKSSLGLAEVVQDSFEVKDDFVALVNDHGAADHLAEGKH